MGKVMVFGGMGALVNCAISLYSSKLTSFSLNRLVDEILVEPLTALRTLSPVALGFLVGTVFLVVWSLLRAMAVRFLLGYNGWFLNRKSPINTVWYVLMMALVGKKNLCVPNYQQFLPSLPVPRIGNTCNRYLESVKPLLTEEEYQETESAVKEFKKKHATRLQFYLWLRYLIKRNWISDWWLEYIYLRQRTPISFNSNYYALGNEVPTTRHQLDRMAMQIYLTIKFYSDKRSGKLKNLLHGVVPFCSDGLSYTYTTARVPGKEMDTIKNFDYRKVNHVVVVRHGKLYKVSAKTKDGEVLPPIVIRRQLEQVLLMAGDTLDETGVAAFTAQNRTKWAEIRERLEQDPLNKATLETIDSSYIFCAMETTSPDNNTDLSRAVFHGNGYNRWFDKSIQVAYFENGAVGSQVEHSPLDATVAGQAWEYILTQEMYDKDGHVLVGPKDDTKVPAAEPEELKWNLKGFQNDLEEAKENVQAMINDSDLEVYITSYGKRIPKKCGLSPDGWFQMAMQLAYYRLHGKFVLTYESATTRFYYKGRTETIRPVSMHSKNFVLAMMDKDKSNEEKKKLLKAAIGYQEQYKFQAMRGKGIDRHLFGLYVIAKWLKMDPMPRIFEDKAFQLKFELSTSQTPTNFIEKWSAERSSTVGGFGTVTDHGYGISYLVGGEDKVSFSIHSKRSCPTTSSLKMAEAMAQSMEDMRELYSEELQKL